MRIIFHLGTYKTGTSSFQNTLFENKDLLLKHGILHPVTGLTNEKKLGYRHTSLITGFMTGKKRACPDALLKEIKDSNAETVIFSSEAWSNPGNLSHLTRFVTELEDNGYNDCSGFLTLRNLAKYQVSHYREFTVNRGNSQTYPEYIQKRTGMFDYLLLIRSFRSIFGSRFSALPFDISTEITRDLFEAMGFGRICNQMKRVERANVKSIGPLEVEAIRCANLLKKSRNEGLSALTSAISDYDNMRIGDWTERFVGDTPSFTSAYRRNLRNAANWSEDNIASVLNHDEPQGRNVQEISDAIIHELQNA